MNKSITEANEIMLKHTPGEGGCPRVDWYALRNEIAAALSAGQAQPVRWMLQETLPSGSIKWSVYEHEHHAQSVADNLPDCVVIPLYASPPAVPGEVETAQDFTPGIVENTEAGISELVIKDGPTVTGREMTVRPLLDMETREIVGFQWGSAPLPEIEGENKGDGGTRPISAPVHRSNDPTWMQVIKLFKQNGMQEPPVRLRDEIVVALEWAWFAYERGQLAAAPSASIEGETE